MKKLALDELPIELRKKIVETSAKIAGWTSPKEKGEGSTMMMEWLTFTYTLKEWKNKLKEIERIL